STGIESLTDFDAAIDAELAGSPDRKYLRTGLYYEGLATYLDLFGNEQVKVYLYEDLSDDPLGLLRDLYQWLGVDDTFAPDVDRRYNVSRVPKHRSVDRALEGDSSLKGLAKRVVPPSLRARMRTRMSSWNGAPAAAMSPQTRQRLV